MRPYREVKRGGAPPVSHVECDGAACLYAAELASRGALPQPGLEHAQRLCVATYNAQYTHSHNTQIDTHRHTDKRTHTHRTWVASHNACSRAVVYDDRQPPSLLHVQRVSLQALLHCGRRDLCNTERPGARAHRRRRRAHALLTLWGGARGSRGLGNAEAQPEDMRSACYCHFTELLLRPTRCRRRYCR